MQAGTLRHRVTFQLQSTIKDETGEQVDTWTSTVTVWGSVEDLSANEVLTAGAASAQVTTLITTRHRAGITSGMRILTGGRTLEITAPPIDKAGRHRQLEILCKEITP